MEPMERGSHICGQPLLIEEYIHPGNTHRAFVETLTTGHTDLKQADMVRWEFRTVEGGETSAPITVCPGCGKQLIPLEVTGDGGRALV